MRTLPVVIGLLAAAAAPSQGQVLFGDAPTPRPFDAASPIGVVRSRPVRVRLSRIPGASARDAARGVLPPRGQRLVLNLFDDVVVRARMTRAERSGGALVWAGKIEGQPLGDVVLAVVGGVLSGSAVWPGGAYRIRFDGSTHVVEQIDPNLFPEDGCFREVPGGAADESSAPVANADDGSLVDVLVVYTPGARTAAGGTPSMLSQVNLAVAETNTGYANSNVVQRLRLAAAVEVSYVEAGDIGVDLDRVTCPKNQVCGGMVLDPDGYLDQVQGLRDTYKADLVSLITETPGSPYCGIAWLMAGNDPAFAPNAYSVVERQCMTGYYSFGHELGHNMGLNHAHGDPTGPGAYSYSYGYKQPADVFRTVMAYCCGYPTCVPYPGCPRILYFSNPDVSYGGSPTGVRESSPNPAYNALSLDNTRVTVANWRASSTAAIRLDTPNGGESWRAGSTRSIAWTPTDLPVGAVVHITYTDGTGRGYRTNSTAGGLIAAVPAAQGSYSWAVPFNPGVSWRVDLCVPTPRQVTRGAPAGRDCLVSDASDAPFTITP
jgi:peptidyl-Asp metalloendopeptidase